MTYRVSHRTRREFVVMTLSSLGAAIAATACRPSRGRSTLTFRPEIPPERLSDDIARLETILRAFFGPENLERVRWVGRAYAQRFSPDVEALIADLSETVTLISGPAPLGDAQAVLDAAIRTEFETTRPVSVFGWQLAPTEARLACLVDVMSDPTRPGN